LCLSVGRTQEARSFLKEAVESDYDHLLGTVMKYVRVR